MAGVVPAGSGTMVVNGSKSAYDGVAGASSQENTTANKNRPTGLRQNSSGSTRTPLSALAPNRKDSSVSSSRVAHNRVEELGQQDAGLIRSGSEPDSLLDLYCSNASSGNVSQAQNDNDIPENMYRPDQDDPDGWIHRDKLAKIESEELQAAGINLANARRNVSKSGGKRDTSRGRRSDEHNPTTADLPRRVVEGEEIANKPSRLAEPVEEEDDDNEQANWDLRNPEEIAADNSAGQMYSNPVLRKSGSKIPVLTSSPLPIAQERIERDTPLVRKRTISNSMSPAEDGIPLPKLRTRKESGGSQPILDDPDSLLTTPITANTSKVMTPTTSSPTKNRPRQPQNSPPGTSAGKKNAVGANATAASASAATAASNRKTSAGHNKPGEKLGPQAHQRPGTRSGELDRPRTAVNRPEGDPPWLATMYKPDPMLPPDEQIIPTHARRQQQAVWEDQGAVPSTYDRNFSPLAIHTGNGLMKEPSPVLPPSSPKDQQTDDGSNAWPLKPGTGASMIRNSAGSGRPGTGGSTNGGYSTMPKVTSPAIRQSPRMGSISSMPTQPNTNRVQVQRLEQPPHDMDEKVKDKSCGCCIVM